MMSHTLTRRGTFITGAAGILWLAAPGALLAEPAAQGLFHKAIIQSGPGLVMCEKADAISHAERTLARLGVKPSDIHKLQMLDYRAINDAPARMLFSS